MIRRKNILKIAIDSPAAAGAGTLAKAISKHYNLLHLDTGRCYRYLANIKISTDFISVFYQQHNFNLHVCLFLSADTLIMFYKQRSKKMTG